MFDAMKLLGSLAQTSAAPSAGDRFGSAASQPNSANPFGQLLSQFTNGGQASGLGGQGSVPPAGQGGLGGLLGGFAEMAKSALISPQQEIRNNNPAAVGGLGALAGALLGGGSGAMGGGLMAVLGSLAYSALQNSGQSQSAPGGAYVSTGAPPAALPVNDADAQRRALLMVKAMIQAAKADGQIDEQETQRIMGKLAAFGHEDEARVFVTDEMRRPIDINGLVKDIRNPQEAAEVYAASMMAIEIDSQAERDYLIDLAAALRLPTSVTSQINNSMGVSV